MTKNLDLTFFSLLTNVLLPTSGKSHLKFGDYCIMNVGIRAKGDFGSMNWTDVYYVVHGIHENKEYFVIVVLPCFVVQFRCTNN